MGGELLVPLLDEIRGQHIGGVAQVPYVKFLGGFQVAVAVGGVVIVFGLVIVLVLVVGVALVVGRVLPRIVGPASMRIVALAGVVASSIGSLRQVVQLLEKILGVGRSNR